MGKLDMDEIKRKAGRVNPIVSVVIPTRGRSQLVVRAVQSVFAQTLTQSSAGCSRQAQLEVVVVVDGPDEATRAKLAEIDDPRLQVVQLPVSQGGAGARNAGVAEAKGEWIAFLDDDDEWLPQKLEQQLEAAKRSQHQQPIVSCRLIARTPNKDFVYPKRFPHPKEPLSEYLLARNTFSFGEGLVQTSTILVKKVLLEKVPFQNLRKHQDWDWLLRAATQEDVGLEFVTEPLAIWYLWEKRTSVSSKSNWQNSLAWIRNNRQLVTPRAYSAFIMVQVGPQAACEGQWQTFLPLLQEAIQLGKPKPIDYLLYFGLWLVPRNVRRSLRALFTQKTQRMSEI